MLEIGDSLRWRLPFLYGIQKLCAPIGSNIQDISAALTMQLPPLVAVKRSKWR
jgi:hypothetical protein